MILTRLLTGTSAMALATTAPLFAQEQEEPVELGEIIIQAVRTGATESSIPGTVQVVEGAQIIDRVRRGQTLSRALSDLVPGLAPANGTIGGASQTLRGRTTQILIDGVARTSELRGFDRELAVLDPNSIERIEIVKGSTARFGNGATGGIINIVTKKPSEEPRTTLETRFSAQDGGGSLSNELFLSHDTRAGDLGLRFELSRSETGNSYDGNGTLLPSDPLVGQGGGDNIERYTFGVAANWSRGPHELDVRLDTYQLEQDVDYFTDYSTNPVRVTDRPYTGAPVEDRGTSANVTYRYDNTALGDLEINAYFTDIERRSALAEPGPANLSYYTTSTTDLSQDPLSQGELFTSTYGVSLTMRTPIEWVGPDAVLTWGLDLGRDEVEQKTLDGRDLLAPMTQDSVAVFAQADIPIGDRLDLSAGLRAERFSLSVSDFNRPAAAQITGRGIIPLVPVDVIGGDFDYDAVVGNLGLVYHLTPSTSIYGGFSQGFSLPDVGAFTRRAIAQPGQTSVSFSDIQPEAQIVDTWELGLRHNSQRISIDSSVYFSTSDEGVVFDAATNTITQQKEEVWGAEFSLDYDIRDDWSAGAQLAYVEGRSDSNNDGDVDTWLPNNRIPTPFTATLYTDKSFENGLTLSGELVFSAKRDHPELPKLENMFRVNVGGSYPVGPGLVTFGVTNLFDRQQENSAASSVRINPLTGDAVRIADEGRRVSVGYTVSF
ncbi:siderophore receptor [Tateyamaria omphalii]|uniref:TonB-dependent receptor n=1 Tax=Tateyamaria omphalii TaxID=299262 RepID=UPI0016777B71|nr:TonB-dependent receptor [Tateyamaria omphalii]GGX67496.1 siderophore receptor [Tateyamaria omphalii]